MTSLCRTVSNGFSLRQAYSLSEVIEYSESGNLGQLSQDAESAFGSRRRCIVPHDGEKYFLNGGIIAFSRVGGVLPENGELLRAYSLESAFLGLARGADDGIKCIWKNNSDPEK